MYMATNINGGRRGGYDPNRRIDPRMFKGSKSMGTFRKYGGTMKKMGGTRCGSGGMKKMGGKKRRTLKLKKGKKSKKSRKTRKTKKSLPKLAKALKAAIKKMGGNPIP